MSLIGDVIKDEIRNWCRKHERLVGWITDGFYAISAGIIIYFLIWLFYLIF